MLRMPFGDPGRGHPEGRVGRHRQCASRLGEIGVGGGDLGDPLGRHLGMRRGDRSEEHTSELQSLMRISYAVFCLKKKKSNKNTYIYPTLQMSNPTAKDS